MHSLMRTTALTCAILILCACTAVTSKHTPLGSKTSNGVDYSLPAGVLTLRIHKIGLEKGYIAYVPSITQPSIVPDPGFTYTLSYDPRFTASDHIVIQKTDSGLLTKVDLKSKDETGSVIATTVDLAKSAIFGIPPEEGPPGTILGTEPGRVLVFEAQFDPFDEMALNDVFSAASAATHKSGENDRLKLSARFERSGMAVGTGQVADSKLCTASICYREMATFDLIVLDDNEVVLRRKISLPDKTRISGFSVERAAFVEKQTILDFSNGILKNVEIEKPSGALELLRIPLDIASALIAVPAEVIQLKIDTASDTDKLHKARTTELDAKLKLLQKERELNKYLLERDKLNEDPLFRN